jgi:DNA-binding transcriptional LysR family regulator
MVHRLKEHTRACLVHGNAILRGVVDLRQLEILQAIAETGSFTACGRKLHVSQSAISRQILLLEDELGEPLFLRVGRQVRMTPAAESLVQLGQRVFLDVRDTVGAITDRTRVLRGTLRLAGGMTVCLYVFPPLLKHLRRAHPHLEVRLTVATARESVQAIRAGRVDAGLLTLPVEESDLITLPVLREELLIITTPTHPLARRKRVAARDLQGLPFVLFEAGSATRQVIDRFFLTEQIAPNVVMDTENVEIIKAMVKTGLGIGIVPYQAVAREVRAGQFFCSRVDGHELVRETGWVYARANRTPRIIHELLEAFQVVRGKLRLAPSRSRGGRVS